MHTCDAPATGGLQPSGGRLMPQAKVQRKEILLRLGTFLDAMRVRYETVTRTEDVGMAITGAVKSMNSME